MASQSQITYPITMQNKDHSYSVRKNILDSIPLGPWTKNLRLFPQTFSENQITCYKERATEGQVKHHVLGYRMYKASKATNILVHYDTDAIIVKADVAAAMKKNIYKTFVAVSNNVMNKGLIEEAKCTCMGGVTGRCKHVFAVLWQLLDFVRTEASYIEDVSVTSASRTWGTGTDNHNISEPFENVPFLKADPMKKNKKTVENIKKRADMRKTHLQNKLDVNKIKELARSLQQHNLMMFCEILKENKFLPRNISENRKERYISVIPASAHQWLREYVDIILSKKIGNLHLINEISLSLERARELELETRNQSESPTWRSERAKRIPSSKFFEIINRKLPINENLIKRIWPKRTIQTSFMALGLSNEENVVEKYRKIFPNYEVLKCGLCITPGIPYLCSSPDRLIFDRDSNSYHLLEIKTLVKGSLEHYSIKECFENGLAQYLDYNNGIFMLKKNHAYYIQIQGQLAITGLNHCDLFVDSGTDYFIEKIIFDIELWVHNYLPKLTVFYFNYFEMSLSRNC